MLLSCPQLTAEMLLAMHFVKGLWSTPLATTQLPQDPNFGAHYLPELSGCARGSPLLRMMRHRRPQV